jgi:hypothetical protein
VCVCVVVGATRQRADLFFTGLAEWACGVRSRSALVVTVPIYKSCFSLPWNRLRRAFVERVGTGMVEAENRSRSDSSSQSRLGFVVRLICF